MRRLIRGFAGRTYHIVGNFMHWLNIVRKSLANVFSTDTLCKQFRSSSDPVNYHGCNIFAHRRETSGTSSDSDQLRPFHKWDFSYRRAVRFEFAPAGSQVFPFRAIPYVRKSLVSTLDKFT